MTSNYQSSKEYLQQVWMIKNDIDRKYEQIATIRSMTAQTTSSHEVVRAGKVQNYSKIENAMIELIIIENELEESITEYTEKYREICAVIDGVENPMYRRLLALRYLSFMPWKDIAADMNYTYRHITRMHGDALRQIRNK